MSHPQASSSSGTKKQGTEERNERCRDEMYGYVGTINDRQGSKPRRLDQIMLETFSKAT